MAGKQKAVIVRTYSAGVHLQAALGSDPIREVLGVCRLAMHQVTEPSRLFQPNDATEEVQS